jgi:hypothetical protein
MVQVQKYLAQTEAVLKSIPVPQGQPERREQLVLQVLQVLDPH